MKKITVTHFIKFEASMKATDMLIAFREIRERVFRPARKHGYSDHRLQQIIDYADKNEEYDKVQIGDFNIVIEAIELLEAKFFDILEENGINIDEGV